MTAAQLRPANVNDLVTLRGERLEPTSWRQITQERIDAFADATDDHQWIHLDTERAAASTLGSTIAHGLFTLSLGPKFMSEIIDFGKFGHMLNYGYDRVRFPAPLPQGSSLRMHIEVVLVEVARAGAKVTLRQTYECRGIERPVCVADAIVLLQEVDDVADGGREDDARADPSGRIVTGVQNAGGTRHGGGMA